MIKVDRIFNVEIIGLTIGVMAIFMSLMGGRVFAATASADIGAATISGLQSVDPSKVTANHETNQNTHSETSNVNIAAIPARPTQAPDLSATSDSGLIDDDNITTYTNLDFILNCASNNETLTLNITGGTTTTQTHSCIVIGDTTVSITVPTGEYDMFVSYSRTVNTETSPDSDPLIVSLDTVSPVAAVITTPVSNSSVPTSHIISGTCGTALNGPDPGYIIINSVSTHVLTSSPIIIDSNGSFSGFVDWELSAIGSTNTLLIVCTDLAGNISSPVIISDLFIAQPGVLPIAVTPIAGGPVGNTIQLEAGFCGPVFAGGTAEIITFPDGILTPNPIILAVNAAGEHESLPLDISNVTQEFTVARYCVAQSGNTDAGSETFQSFIPNLDSDSILNIVENSSPNGGDANNDNVPDMQQANVASLPYGAELVGGSAYLSLDLTQGDCNIITNAKIVAESTLTQSDIGYTYPLGLVDYTAAGCVQGTTQIITLYYYTDISYEQLVLRKYNNNLREHTTIQGAQISSITIDGKKVIKVVYSVTDGGQNDQDLAANGVIVDPVGLALPEGVLPETGLSPVTAMLSGAALVVTAFTVVRIRTNTINIGQNLG